MTQTAHDDTGNETPKPPMIGRNLPQPSRKKAIVDLANDLAPERDAWIEKNRYFHSEDDRYFSFLISEGQKILQLGCGNGRLLKTLKPSYGVGVDLSAGMIEQAQANVPECTFIVGDMEDPELIDSLEGPFDVIIISDTIGYLDDCEATFASLHSLCNRDTRLVVAYYSWLWSPVLKMAEAIGQHVPQVEMNWFSTDDITGLLELADFEPVKMEWRQLVPIHLLGLGPLINRFIGTLPGIRNLCLRNYIVARPMRDAAEPGLSCSVLIPCRNEKGNIEPAVQRLPRFCDDIEILYVEGGSQDGTFEECERVRDAYPQYDIKVFKQDGIGKGDAVRKGFGEARGDILMILDADLTVPPETLPKFYKALAEGKGEYINGTRLIYPMEREAMRFLNFWANRTFSWLFSWLLNQKFTDTLCGTKVMRRRHYERLAANRAYFGDFDPFGDFDLIFGSAKMNLKIVEVPIRYAARRYGETQISRFRHGWLLLQMVVFAFKKLKAF
ncbi:MAG: glycosyltransferase [Magnetococcales bacterium]|nr:glycosyltransferase [Magnetococcales bacterium]